MKIQVALAVERAIASEVLNGAEARLLVPERRTSGPTGISLMRDQVTMSLRDLAVAMLTIGDDAATDELINVVGLEAINLLAPELGRETADAGQLRIARPLFAP
jgi:beta-lactamase class A